MRLLHITVMGVLLGGCNSLDFRECTAVENPNQFETYGIIIDKVFVEGPVTIALPMMQRVNEDFRNDPAVMAGIAGGLGSVSGAMGAAAGTFYVNSQPKAAYQPTLDDPCPSTEIAPNAYRYVVKVREEKQFVVLSQWPNFEIGQCAKLFLVPESNGQITGRITDGTGCKENP